MKKFLLYSFIILIVVTGCKNGTGKSGHNPANETEANIYRSADSMMAAFKRKDWPTFAHYNHRAMMKMM